MSFMTASLAAGSDELHDRFFGGKATGQLFDAVFVPVRIGLLCGGEHALQKTVWVFFEHRLDPPEVHQINSVSHDPHG
jgi:hypothetical protein